MVALALTENEANSASSTARGGFLETEPWKRRKGQTNFGQRIRLVLNRPLLYCELLNCDMRYN